MGRTLRKRQSKRKLNGPFIINYDIDSHMVQLKKWLTANNWRDDNHIKIAKFPQSGRGVLFKHKVHPLTSLITIPYHAMITLNTLEQDTTFKNIISVCKQKISIHGLFCIYLLWHKHLSKHSSWFHYISTIPMSFSVPYFCTESEKNLLPKYVNDVIKSHVIQINGIDLFVSKYLSNMNCYCCHFRGNDLFKKSDIEWAFFAINTRCVYIDPEVVELLLCGERHILDLISDKPSIALAPLLDMFNHSNHAQTKAELNMDIISIQREMQKGHVIQNIIKNDFNIPNSNMSNMNKNIDLCYKLYTLKGFEAYSECFISYGKHSNLKLLTEYGFLVNDNRNDFVFVCLDDINAVAKIHGVIITYKQQKFMIERQLNDHLFISLDGCSYNLITLLHLYFNKNLKSFNKIYDILNIQDIRKPIISLINNKKMEINNHIKSLLNVIDPSESALIVRDYLKQQLVLLNTAIGTFL